MKCSLCDYRSRSVSAPGRRTLTEPFDVRTRIAGPPEPIVVSMLRLRPPMRPCTVIGKSTLMLPFVVPATSRAL